MSEPKMLTTRETEVAVLAWRTLEGDLKLDLQQFATLTGLKNVPTARVTWNALKRKLLEGNYVAKTSGATPMKRTAATAVGAKGDDDSNPTPSKKARAPTRASKKMAAPVPASSKDEDDDDDDDDDEVKKEVRVKPEVN